MSAISKEKIKICVLTKIQDIWTEWPDVPINVTVVFMNIYIYIEKPAGGAAVHRNRQNKYCGTIGREYMTMNMPHGKAKGLVDYCKPTYFRGYYVSRFPASRQFRRDLISR